MVRLPLTFLPPTKPQLQLILYLESPSDWDMPYEHMEFAISVWKGNFFNHLVGKCFSYHLSVRFD